MWFINLSSNEVAVNLKIGEVARPNSNAFKYGIINFISHEVVALNPKEENPPDLIVIHLNKVLVT